MAHHFRVSASRQFEIINESIAIYEEMRDHVSSCTVCDDEEGICALGQEIWKRVERAQNKLKQIGFEQ